MPGLAVRSKPLVSAKRPYPADIGTVAKMLEDSRNPALVGAANALRNIQGSLNELHSVVRNNNPEVTEIVVHDAAGRVVAAIGDFIFQQSGVATRNYFSEIHIGDPLGTGNPADAVINVNANGQITVGSTGWFDVLDPYGASAAWIGTQFDTLPITGAVTSSGLIRLTVVGHAFVTGDTAIVRDVGGVENATGTFTITKIDATHVDLQSSVFVGTYTSGGTITRLLHVSGAVNNGAGLIRLTVTAHGYESGDRVNVVNVGGVSNATGQWTITVITVDTFDLRASTFAGTYTSGGTVIRYFAGGLFQTVAVGPSFAGYTLRAFPDGTLKIKNAEIVLTGSGATIDLDPTTGTITITQSGGGDQVFIQNGFIELRRVDSGGAVDLDGSDSRLEPGHYTSSKTGISTLAGSLAVSIAGWTGSTEFGPIISFTQSRGTPTSATETQSGDTIGGLIAYGFDGTGENAYTAGIRAVATEAHGTTAHGTKIIFEVTADGSAITTTPVVFDQSGFAGFGGTTTPAYAVHATGDINATGVFRKNGTAGISPTRTRGQSLTVNTSGTGVFGTPGVGQSNGTVVTGVTLNTISDTFSGGILTA